MNSQIDIFKAKIEKFNDLYPKKKKSLTDEQKQAIEESRYFVNRVCELSNYDFRME